MKKFFIFFILIFNLSFSFDASIATYNVLRLGRGEKDIEYLAKTIEPFDLVGLIEVMDERGVFELLRVLNKNDTNKWGYHISSHPVGTDTYKEYYAYVFKNDKVNFVSSLGYFPDKDNDFIREPYGATFKINNFDFSLILAHSIYGKKVSQRQFEANELIHVYNYFQDLDESENDIIIGGDFNLPADDSSFSSLLEKDNIIYALDPNIKTTIGTKGFANSYDNIFLSKDFTTEFEGDSGALNIVPNSNFSEIRKEVSDHIPVFIIVNTEKDDD